MTKITDDNQHVIVYDDGDIETLNMNNQEWRFSDTNNDNVTNSSNNNDDNSNDNDATLHPSTVCHLPTLKSNEQDYLRSLFEHFGNTPFIISETQGFPQSCIINAYKTE